MAEQTTKFKLSQLNYSAEWLEYGILTEHTLNEQIEEFNLNRDQNTEHYRFKVMQDYIRSKEHIDDHVLGLILDLMQIDVDKSMAASVLIGILKDQSLTNDQFAKVAKTLKTFGEWTLKHIEKARISR